MKTILPWFFWILVIGATVGIVRKAYAEPLYAAEGEEGIRIVLYSEDCALGKPYDMLPRRATWTEKGVTIEGCVGLHRESGMFVFLWTDNTQTQIPAGAFHRVLSS